MKHNHTRELVLLGGGSAAVLLVGCLYLQFGWKAGKTKLVHLTGDTAALQGFTLTGATYDSFNEDRFIIKDGVVENSYRFDTVMQDFFSDNQTSVGCNVYVSSAALEEVDSRAKEESYPGLFTYTERTSTAKDFTENVVIMFPDLTRVRLKLGEHTAPYPITVQATVNPKENTATDYRAVPDSWPEEMPGEGGSWEEALYDMAYGGTGRYGSKSSFKLGENWGLCWRKATDEMQPGLYRAIEALTVEEVEALPKNGTVAGVPITTEDVPFGKLEHFYTPEDALLCFEAVEMEDGYTALLWMAEDMSFRVDLVDETGRCTDSRHVLNIEPTEYYAQYVDYPTDFEILPRENKKEAAFVILRAGGEGAGSHYLVPIMRAEQGKFTVFEVLKTQSNLSDDLIGQLAAVALNEKGDAAMLVHRNYREYDYPADYYEENHVWYEDCGYQVQVVSLPEQKTLYTGWLDNGAGRDWSATSGLLTGGRHETQFAVYGVDSKGGAAA